VSDRRSIFRLLALAGFLLTVALALWLAELRPLPAVILMAIALLLAWAVEWFWWRQDVACLAVDGVDSPGGEVAGPPSPGASEPEPAPAEPEVHEADSSPPVEPALEPASRPPQLPGSGPEPEPGPEPEVRREQGRPSLRAVPPPPAPERSAGPPQPDRPTGRSSDVIDLRTRVTAQPRQWNLWDLERRAREEAERDRLRYEEWSYLFVHLRQFAAPDGSLPIEFDGLVRESFAELLDQPG
jgi:hypothetical protein